MTAASSRDRARLDHALDAGGPVRWGALAWVEMVLRDQEMPPDELRVVLTTPDRELVRHHLELHLERLEEWLSTQRRSLAAVERIVAEAIERPRNDALSTRCGFTGDLSDERHDIPRSR